MKKKGAINLVMMSECFYEQVEPGRRQEKRDGEMIPAFSNSIGNCPQQEINREFNAWAQVERFYNPANE